MAARVRERGASRRAFERLPPRNLASFAGKRQVRVVDLEPAMNKLDSLREMSVVVADTGDMGSIKDFKPTDSTTNPTLILKASQLPAYKDLCRGGDFLGQEVKGASRAR